MEGETLYFIETTNMLISPDLYRKVIEELRFVILCIVFSTGRQSHNTTRILVLIIGMLDIL